MALRLEVGAGVSVSARDRRVTVLLGIVGVVPGLDGWPQPGQVRRSVGLTWVGPVDADFDSFQSDEAVSDHAIEGGEDGFDLVAGVDALDDDGEVF